MLTCFAVAVVLTLALVDEVYTQTQIGDGPGIRNRLSRLRRRGLLTGGTGDTGYGITEAGRALLAAWLGSQGPEQPLPFEPQ